MTTLIGDVYLIAPSFDCAPVSGLLGSEVEEMIGQCKWAKEKSESFVGRDDLVHQWLAHVCLHD